MAERHGQSEREAEQSQQELRERHQQEQESIRKENIRLKQQYLHQKEVSSGLTDTIVALKKERESDQEQDTQVLLL